MKRTLILLLSAALLLGCCGAVLGAEAEPSPGFGNLRPTADYADGMFSDVPADSPYRDSVAAVYALGLMRGGSGAFGMSEPLSFGEALVAICRLHSLFHTGKAEFESGEPWYAPYTSYASENGIPSEASDYSAPVQRGELAEMLIRALPGAALPGINEIPIGRVSDVTAVTLHADAIYTLYRAGIFTGATVGRTRFRPEEPISHADAAAALSRMACRSLRVKFSIPEWPWPDLEAMPRAEDDYFAGSAMLGASLVQGMNLYSGLQSAMDFYCGQGPGLGGAEEWIAALCQHGGYDRVYIEYGADDLYLSAEDFVSTYGMIIDRLRAAMPDAELYVMAVTPVTKERSDSGEYPMSKIEAFNAALYTMCEQKQCWYLDCFTPLLGEDGYLKPEYAGWDGSPHLEVAGYETWEDAIRTHYR
ncbi:MAG: S-layer homology domain-containing protein [Oscillospiraceae bacterium]|nr:S-layer homology domain-containing protein [Oscillospiraceae bacterium]